jgi:hypothetical protein
VILTERSEVESESRRQPAVSAARSAVALGGMPLFEASLLAFGQRIVGEREMIGAL